MATNFIPARAHNAIATLLLCSATVLPTVAAAAPSFVVFGAAIGIVGITAVVAQVIVPLSSSLAAEHEPYVFAGREVYVNYTHGLGKSKLAERFSATVGVSATVRTLRTVQKVVALAPE